MPRKIDISYKTVIFITVFILSLWLIYLILDLLLILFVGLILMSALTPLIKFFVRLKLPKALAIATVYIIIIMIVAGVFAIILPPLIEQTNKLSQTLPPLISHLIDSPYIDKNIFQSEITAISRNLFSLTVAAFHNFLTAIFLLVLTFYLLLEREKLEAKTAALFGSHEDRVKKLIIEIEEKLGSWLRGQMLLSVIIGMLSYIGLSLLAIPFALPLAILAGLLEVVPVIGPIISSLPGILLALTISPVLAAGVAAMFFVIQQLENHLIVPQVMKRAVGLNPLVVILAIAIGSRLLGFAGALLAVPIAVVLQIIVTEVIEGRKI